jgi:Uma2 family endonuclease
MSTAPDHRRVSLQEYLAWEERSETKHEYYRGEIFAMAGATIQHNRIASNFLARLHQLLEGKPCEVFGSDLRLRVNAVDLSTYPDISVVCGGAKMDAVDKNAIVNPRVLVEVLSESTKGYDTGRKFEFYRTLDSLVEYVIVEQTEAKIVHYARQDDGTWRHRLIVGMEANLSLDSIGCEVALKAIYRNVEFQPRSDAPVDDIPVRSGTPR